MDTRLNLARSSRDLDTRGGRAFRSRAADSHGSSPTGARRPPSTLGRPWSAPPRAPGSRGLSRNHNSGTSTLFRSAEKAASSARWSAIASPTQRTPPAADSGAQATGSVRLSRSRNRGTSPRSAGSTGTARPMNSTRRRCVETAVCFQSRVVQRLDYGEVDAVMIGADNFSWVQAVASDMGIAAADRERLWQGADDFATLDPGVLQSTCVLTASESCLRAAVRRRRRSGPGAGRLLAPGAPLAPRA